MSDDGTTTTELGSDPRTSRRRWCGLAIFIPAIMTRPAPRSTTPLASTPVSTSAVAIPGPLGGPQVAMDVNTLLGRPAPAFTLLDSEERSFPVSSGGGTRTVLIFNMGVT